MSVDDEREWTGGDDERGWMNVVWTRGVRGQQTFTCVMVNIEMAFSRISACSTLHLN